MAVAGAKRERLALLKLWRGQSTRCVQTGHPEDPEPITSDCTFPSDPIFRAQHGKRWRRAWRA